MVTLNRCATANELHGLLSGSDPSEKDPLVIHIEHCQKCQRQLSNLVADEDGWHCSRDALLVTQSERNGSTIEPSGDSSGVLTPFQLGSYEIVKTIGFGGMATVYQGVDSELNRVVAIKVLHPHLANAGASRQRFLKEAQSAAAIVHPNIIPIYGVYLSEGRPFLAMPLIHGGSLQQRIDREGPLPLADALSIALQISEALAAAHSKGVVHRDVKPANILLEDGKTRIILSDFGLARTLDDAHQTASGIISGTPAYMSPEQSRGETVDARSDLYSLGCVLFAMCTGHAPYQATSALKMLRVVNENPFPSVHRYQEHLPLWVDSLVQLLTAKSPRDRPANASEAAQTIRECLLHCNNTTLQLPALPGTKKQLSPRNKYVVLQLLLAVLIAGSGFTFARFSPSNQPSKNVLDGRNSSQLKTAMLPAVGVVTPPLSVATQPQPREAPPTPHNSNPNSPINKYIPSPPTVIDGEWDLMSNELSQMEEEFNIKLNKKVYQ